jgi:hypothetical protein
MFLIDIHAINATAFGAGFTAGKKFICDNQ